MSIPIATYELVDLLEPRNLPRIFISKTRSCYHNIFNKYRHVSLRCCLDSRYSRRIINGTRLFRAHGFRLGGVVVQLKTGAAFISAPNLLKCCIITIVVVVFVVVGIIEVPPTVATAPKGIIANFM